MPGVTSPLARVSSSFTIGITSSLLDNCGGRLDFQLSASELLVAEQGRYFQIVGQQPTRVLALRG